METMPEIVVGCDFHSRFQQIAVFNRATGELSEHRLEHPDEALRFYQTLPAGSEVGIEAGSPAPWFERVLERCGHRLRVGDAAEVRRRATPGRKNDRRDAQLLLDLLLTGRFPEIWWAGEEVRDRRNLVLHRHRLVQARTRVLLQLKALARSQGLVHSTRGLTRLHRLELEGLVLPPHTTRRRRSLLAQWDWLSQEIALVTPELTALAQQDPVSRLLLTHPGVGAVTAVYLPLVIGDPTRFASGGALANYLGLTPSENSSGQRQAFGRVTKQGSRMARGLLIEAAHTAAQLDPELKRFYLRLAHRKERQKAKVAVARKLAIRLLLMWKRQMDYQQFIATAAPCRQARQDA